jgi:transformation/transcription domain-associated protein
MQMMKKAIAARASAVAQASAESSRRSTSDQPMRDGSEPNQAENMNAINITPAAPSAAPEPNSSNTGPISMTPNHATSDPSHPRAAWEHVDEILQTLKTTFPLLILSLETMVDQIQHKFKPSPEEEVYRSICMLLSDAVQVYSLLFFGVQRH